MKILSLTPFSSLASNASSSLKKEGMCTTQPVPIKFTLQEGLMKAGG
jgi:hypothetical protein